MTELHHWICISIEGSISKHVFSRLGHELLFNFIWIVDDNFRAVGRSISPENTSFLGQFLGPVVLVDHWRRRSTALLQWPRKTSGLSFVRSGMRQLLQPKTTLSWESIAKFKSCFPLYRHHYDGRMMVSLVGDTSTLSSLFPLSISIWG